ncbi:MAG: outer membrane beta-barrel protein [Burkholderiales bacterium]
MTIDTRGGAACVGTAMVLAVLAGAPGARAADGATYVGITVGGSQSSGWCSDVNGPQCDDSGRVGKLSVGHEYGRHLAVEAFYAYLGRTTGTDTTQGSPIRADAKYQAVGLSALGLWPVCDGLSVFGKAGIAAVQMRLNAATATGPSGTAINTSGNLLLGLGLRWNAIDNVVFRLEWERYFDVGGVPVHAGPTRLDTGKSDLDVLGVGIEYRF